MEYYPFIFWMNIELINKPSHEIESILSNWIKIDSLIPENINNVIIFTDINMHFNGLEKESKLNENFFFCKSIISNITQNNKSIYNNHHITISSLYFFEKLRNIFSTSEFYILYWNEHCKNIFDNNKFQKSYIGNKIRSEKSIVIFLRHNITDTCNINEVDNYDLLKKSIINNKKNYPTFIFKSKDVLHGIIKLFNKPVFYKLIFYKNTNYINEFIFKISFIENFTINDQENKYIREKTLKYIRINYNNRNNIDKYFANYQTIFPFDLNLQNLKYDILFSVYNKYEKDETPIFHERIIYMNDTIFTNVVDFIKRLFIYIDIHNIDDNIIFGNNIDFKIIYVEKKPINWDFLFYSNILNNKPIFIESNIKKENNYIFDKNILSVPRGIYFNKNHTYKYIYKYKKIQEKISFFNLNNFSLFLIKTS